jgi:hypothetical protein
VVSLGLQIVAEAEAEVVVLVVVIMVELAEVLEGILKY